MISTYKPHSVTPNYSDEKNKYYEGYDLDMHYTARVDIITGEVLVTLDDATEVGYCIVANCGGISVSCYSNCYLAGCCGSFFRWKEICSC